jgi:hypothetical protein
MFWNAGQKYYFMIRCENTLINCWFSCIWNEAVGKIWCQHCYRQVPQGICMPFAWHHRECLMWPLMINNLARNEMTWWCTVNNECCPYTSTRMWMHINVSCSFSWLPYAFRNVFMWKSSRDSQNNSGSSDENSSATAPSWTLFGRLGSKSSEQDSAVNVVCFITICSVCLFCLVWKFVLIVMNYQQTAREYSFY